MTIVYQKLVDRLAKPSCPRCGGGLKSGNTIPSGRSRIADIVFHGLLDLMRCHRTGTFTYKTLAAGIFYIPGRELFLIFYQ